MSRPLFLKRRQSMNHIHVGPPLFNGQLVRVSYVKDGERIDGGEYVVNVTLSSPRGLLVMDELWQRGDVVIEPVPPSSASPRPVQ